MDRGPEMNMKDEAGLGLAIHWVQQAQISAYEDNCPLRPVKTGRQSLKWMSELESLRRGVRQLFNKCQRAKNLRSWELYRDAQRRLPKRLGGLTVVPLATYLGQLGYTGLYLGSLRSKIRLEPLLAPSRGCTQSEGETLDLLLATHFPNSLVIGREVAPAAACCVKRVDWHVAARVVTYGKVVWATDSFAPYKSPGMDRIFLAMLQEGQGVLTPYLVKIFVPAWQLATFQPYGARLR